MRRQHHDRDEAPIGAPLIGVIAGVVGDCPRPEFGAFDTLRLVGDEAAGASAQQHFCHWVGTQVVIPGGVAGAAVVGGDQDDSVAIGQKDERGLAALPATGANGGEQKGGIEDRGETEPPAREWEQDKIDWAGDVADEPCADGRGEQGHPNAPPP